MQAQAEVRESGSLSGPPGVPNARGPFQRTGRTWSFTLPTLSPSSTHTSRFPPATSLSLLNMMVTHRPRRCGGCVGDSSSSSRRFAPILLDRCRPRALDGASFSGRDEEDDSLISGMAASMSVALCLPLAFSDKPRDDIRRADRRVRGDEPELEAVTGGGSSVSLSVGELIAPVSPIS